MDAVAVNRTVEVARERRIDLHQALIDLEHAIASPAPGRAEAWTVDVRAALEHVERALEQHIRGAEGPEGLFEEVIARAPRLANKCRRLTQEHGQIRDALQDVKRHLDGDPDLARDRIMGLLALLARHRQRGADLIYEAFGTDIGGSE